MGPENLIISGSGIDREAIAKLLTPFHTRRSADTGLGMGIAMMLLEAHGRRIRIKSQPGRGALMSLQHRSPAACKAPVLEETIYIGSMQGRVVFPYKEMKA